MKKENGMTFPVLAIIIAIIIALICIAAVFINNEYKQKEFENIRTDMLTVQGKVELLAENSAAKKDVTLKKGLKVSENEEDEKIKMLLEKGIISKEENYDNYYILNRDILNEIGLESIKIEEGNYIVVNYTTHEVIYTQGIQIDNNEYFKLSEINKIQEERENEEALKKEQDANSNQEENKEGSQENKQEGNQDGSQENK